VGLILALAGLPAISLAAAVTLTEKPAVLSVGSVEIAEPILSVPSPSSGNPASVEQAVGALSAVVTAQTQQPTQQLGVVTGTIRTRTGTPAAAIRVTAIASGDQSPSTARLERSAITDALGRYRIEDVPPGRYLIAAGNSPHFSYYPGGAVASEARVITINASSIMQNVDFSTLGPIVRGRVNRIPPGLPADVIKIILRPEPTSGWRRDPKAGSPLAVDGTFEFSDVQPGSYTVLTNPQPFFLRDDEPAMPGPIWQSTIRVDRDIQDVLLELPAVIFGRVSVDDGSSLPVTQDDQARGTWSKVSVSAGTFATSPTTSVLTSGTRAPVRSDGWFIMPRPPGPTVAIDLPPGYDLKSITSGGVELQQNRLPTAAGSIEIRVTLTRRLDQRE
jgi:hypothetical protein